LADGLEEKEMENHGGANGAPSAVQGLFAQHGNVSSLSVFSEHESTALQDSGPVMGPVDSSYEDTESGQTLGEVESDAEKGGGADGAPCAEEMAEWRGRMVVEQKVRVWKNYSGPRFQSRSSAVEWRGSVVLDQEVLPRLPIND